MIVTVLKYLVSFIGLVLLQGLILNNIELGGYVNPYLYVVFILMLPFETPKWLTLIIAFVLGFIIDMFTSTLGMHLSATIFMAFCREYFLKLIAPRGGYEFSDKPNMQVMGISWYLLYASVLVLAHHLFLFYIESFKITQFFSTFFRALSSAIFTLVLIFILQLFNYKSSDKS